MPEIRRIQRNSGVPNSSLNPSGHNIEEAIRRLRIQTDGKEDENGSTVYPERPGEPDCIHYLRTGVCGYGDTCKFNHPTYNGQVNHHGGDLPERIGEPDCVYFLKTGACKYGSTCKYNHPRDRRGAGPVLLNMVGLPMRQGQKSCPHYLRTGSCKFGVTCKFHHPQPPLDGSSLLASGPLPPAPSSAPPHIGGVPPWPYPSPQTYVPIVLPPSGTTQGWNPYIGNMSSVLPTNGSGSTDPMYQSNQSSHLPERPGEPECHHFMNTGTCKYGSNCKFHHPREHMAQPGATSLSPLGLPLRPGQPVCSYYSQYGICNMPSCKYDHPFVVYSYNYNMGLPSLPMLDPLQLSYGSAHLVKPHSSGSSPPKPSKNPGWTNEPTSNGKLSTNDESSPEHVGSSHSSPHNHSD